MSSNRSQINFAASTCTWLAWWVPWTQPLPSVLLWSATQQWIQGSVSFACGRVPKAGYCHTSPSRKLLRNTSYIWKNVQPSWDGFVNGPVVWSIVYKSQLHPPQLHWSDGRSFESQKLIPQNILLISNVLLDSNLAVLLQTYSLKVNFIHES